MIISRAMRITRATWVALLALVCGGAQAVAQNQTTNKTESSDASKPQLVMQTGRAGAVDVVAPSPDGRIVVTGSAGGSACLWEAASERGEMVMVVDACHSAAAVAGTNFKPGPMGSRGLGQLAYDKGMRVLTATQTDNVALETNQVRQGLLSYALVQNGLRGEGQLSAAR